MWDLGIGMATPENVSSVNARETFKPCLPCFPNRIFCFGGVEGSLIYIAAKKNGVKAPAFGRNLIFFDFKIGSAYIHCTLVNGVVSHLLHPFFIVELFDSMVRIH